MNVISDSLEKMFKIKRNLSCLAFRFPRVINISFQPGNIDHEQRQRAIRIL